MMRVQELATRTGDLQTALAAARGVLELVPLDDNDAQRATQFSYVELLRAAGDHDSAIVQLERITRDDPLNLRALEALADAHVARGDWRSASRYLYLLVPLAPTPAERAERLYRLGDAILNHLGDAERAGDVFLRASDLDPSHVPTLRRLLDVYWRADDPASLVEVATELVQRGGLVDAPIAAVSIGKAIVAAALVGDTKLAGDLVAVLGDAAPDAIAGALGQLAGRPNDGGRFELDSASIAIVELGRRGLVDVAKIRDVAMPAVAAAL
jgi:tetratricopeptide (TPR) repeat protein